MNILNKIRFYIKANNTPLSHFLYVCVKKMSYLSLPAPRLLFTPLLYIHITLSRSLRSLLVFFYWKPLFLQYLESKPSCFILHNTMPFVLHNPIISIGEYCNWDGNQAVIIARTSPTMRPKLTIGNHVFIGFDVEFNISNEIVIGDRCMIAHGCCFRGFSGHSISPQHRFHENDKKDLNRSIILGENVWLCEAVKIMPGVSIGDNSVIATGSIVTKDIPANVLAGGIPAKILKHL